MIILTKHVLQIFDHKLHIIIASHRHEESQMHHVVSPLQLLRQRLEDVESGKRHIRSIPLFGLELLVRDVEAVDSSSGQLTSKFSDPNASRME